MLAKCANPSCTASFHYLQEGRLFRLEADPESIPYVNPYASGPTTKVEYFWLCGRCAESLALRLGQDGAVVTGSLPDPARGNAEDFPIISRHKDMLLRSVSLGRGRGGRQSSGKPAWDLQP